MYTINETAAAEANYIATLVRGEFYALRDKVFRPGERHVISEAHMVHLEEHAHQVRTIFDPSEGTNIPDFISMFAFELHEGPEPVGHRFPSDEELDEVDRKAAQRERSRRVALVKAEMDGAPARTRTRPRAA